MEHLEAVERVLAPVKRPYYIVTPPYMRTSAGVKALHILAHALNKKGYPAYVSPQFLIKNRSPVHPELNTPLLTQEIAEMHFHEGRTPIVIYPEITEGNPLNAPCIVRYVLNFPGILGGSVSFPEDEFLLYYSKDLITADVEREKEVLFVPASDPRIFSPKDATERTKKVFYAKKFKKYHGGKLPDYLKNFTEIKLGEPGSQTLPEIIELFQEAKVFYAFENTALCIEAILCGCPVVFKFESSLQGQIAATELGNHGITRDDSEESINQARRETKLYRDNYLKQYDIFWNKLDSFIEKTQKKAAGIEYLHPIKFRRPRLKDHVLIAGIKAGVELLKQERLQALPLIFKGVLSKKHRNDLLSKLRKIYVSKR